MSKKSEKEEQRKRALDRLHSVLSSGDEVYAMVKKVSSSGMSRHIAILVAGSSRERQHTVLNVSVDVATVLGWGWGDYGSVVVKGCGMDMAFHAVYALSSAMYPDGFDCVGEHCPSNDHSNGDRNYRPHPHRDGGYALVKISL